jgi:hypothetical protein
VEIGARQRPDFALIRDGVGSARQAGFALALENFWLPTPKKPCQKMRKGDLWNHHHLFGKTRLASPGGIQVDILDGLLDVEGLRVVEEKDDPSRPCQVASRRCKIVRVIRPLDGRRAIAPSKPICSSPLPPKFTCQGAGVGQF